MTDDDLGTVVAATAPQWRLMNTPVPFRLALRPRTREGYPVPWFVRIEADGSYDIRLGAAEKLEQAIGDKLCWVCGVRLGRYVTFVIGPMCAVNRITADPPSHRECAEYSAQVCPFLSVPQMVRRQGGRPDDTMQIPGVHDDSNPGLSVTWTTLTYTVYPKWYGGGDHPLIGIGTPTHVDWWYRGRRATSAAARFALEQGLVKLRDVAAADRYPEFALETLQAQYAQALRLLPAK